MTGLVDQLNLLTRKQVNAQYVELSSGLHTYMVYMVLELRTVWVRCHHECAKMGMTICH